MKMFALLLSISFALTAFALQLPNSGLKEITATAMPSIAPTVTFSSVGLVSSIQMTGTANWSYGSDQRSGTVLLQASAAGQSRMEFQNATGTRVETDNPFTDAERQCTWTDFDGTVHASAAHHCWTDTVWFLPQMTMQLGAGAPDDSASATAAPDGKIMHIHHERHPVGVRDIGTAKLLARLSAVDLDIDASSGLPLQLNFAVHPDNDAGTDIPVQVQFSDYRSVNGVTIPFRIQKFINNSLVLDLQISTAQIQLASSPASLSPLAQ